MADPVLMAAKRQIMSGIYYSSAYRDLMGIPDPDKTESIVENDTMLWEILVPTVRNNGRPFRTRYHRVWDKKVREITGGLTIFTPAKGQWVSPDGELFTERMIPVRIACTREQMDEIIALTLKYYDQIAVMAYVIANEVVLKYR